MDLLYDYEKALPFPMSLTDTFCYFKPASFKSEGISSGAEWFSKASEAKPIFGLLVAYFSFNFIGNFENHPLYGALGLFPDYNKSY